jgi:hypothetical protein
LTKAGLTVEHFERLPNLASDDDALLIVIDRAARQLAGDALTALGMPVVVVGDSLDDDGLITLMLEAPVSHLVGDLGADRDLQITTEKLVTGDLFGLEKYLGPCKVAERVVADDAEKRRAMTEVCSWAEAIGIRRPIVHRLASVVDELLMNALHDAPGVRGQPSQRAVLRWACDEQTLAVSVGDGFGALRQRDVLDNLRRARSERGRPRAAEETAGAGLGLYLVLANVASLIVNVTPGSRTEVVCLFDRAGLGRRAVTSSVRSLHVFEAAS